MDQQPQPRRSTLLTFIGGLLLGAVTALAFALPWLNQVRPQLDVKNTGSSPILVRSGETEGLVLQPDGSISLRVSPGESLTVNAGQTGKSKTIQIGSSGRPLHITANINANDPDKIEVEYALK